MLRIALNKLHPALSSVSRDGKPMLDVTEVNIHASITDLIVHLKHVESDGNTVKERDEVVRGGEEDMELLFV